MLKNKNQILFPLQEHPLRKILLLCLFLFCIFISQSFAAGNIHSNEDQSLIIMINDLQGQPLSNIDIDITISFKQILPLCSKPHARIKKGTTSSGKIQFSGVPFVQDAPITIAVTLNNVTEEINTKIPKIDDNKATITITPSAGWFKSVSASNVFI